MHAVSCDVLPALWLLACPGPSSVDSDPPGDSAPPPANLDPATVALRGACALAYDFGGFEVAATDEKTEVAGAVANGVVPERVLEQTAAAGDCVVLRRNNPYCEPACDPGYTCDFDGTCLPYPSNMELGTVSVGGLVQAVSMTATFPGNTYFDTTLPHPGFTAGDVVYLEMPGGTYGPATMFGVAPESVGAAPTWAVDPSAALVVTWPAPTLPVVRSTARLTVSIDQHGITPSLLQCDFADTGEGTVPVEAVAALVSGGVTGFPSGSLSRRTADSLPAGEGCMDLVVSWTTTATVSVEGHTPCVSTDDCPDGQDCNLELQTCE